MSVPRPDHLLAQADELITASTGPIRQVDLRRAISAAYYALFHHLTAAVADAFVGSTQRATRRYALVYRSVDHRALKELCLEARKSTLSRRYGVYVPAAGFGVELLTFARAAIELQEQRHLADYDPQPRFTRLDASLAIGTARSGITSLDRADRERRQVFLTLLAFPPR